MVHNQGDDPILIVNRRIAASIGIIVILFVLVVPIQTTTAKSQFVLAEWEYPSDEYGQGIKRFNFYDNSTGSWVEFSDPGGYLPDNKTIVECPAGVGIKIRITTTVNSTFLGLDNVPQGINYIRHNLTVISLGETIFSQQNFTMFGYGQIGAMYSYHYDVILGFLPVSGTFYMLTFTYEIYY